MASDSATCIYLQDGYQIVFDRDNWILSQSVVRTRQADGEEYEAENVIGYYSDPAPAARAYLMEHLHEQGDQSVQDFIATIERAQQAVTTAIHKASGWPVSPAPKRRN